MPKETKEQKAIRYLTEGHVDMIDVDIAAGRVVADVYSDAGGEPYIVRRTSAGWTCDCPAQVTPCSHILAVLLVVPSDVKDKHRGASVYTGEDEFSDLLDGN